MKDVCRTSWIERVNGMDTFEELFIPIIYCLEKMKFNKDNRCNRDISVNASSFLTLVFTFKFIACLVLIRSVLNMTLPVTQLLQSKSIDICDGLHLIESLKTLVIKMLMNSIASGTRKLSLSQRKSI